MPFYFLIAVLPAASAIALGSVALYAWQRREINGARSFALSALSIFIWCFFAVFEQLSLSETARTTFSQMQYLGITSFPVFWFVFTLRYAQYDGWLTQKWLGLISVIPVLSLLLVIGRSWQGWMWCDVSLQRLPYPYLSVNYGWWFEYLWMPYAYMLLLAGVGVLMSASFTGSRLHRQQTLVLLASALGPFVCNVLYVVSGITLYGLDLTPVGFGVTGILLHMGLFRVRFLDIAPVSYRTVFLNTADAVILLDVHHRIVDLNPSALAECRFPIGVESAVGQAFDQVFLEYGGLLDLDAAGELTQTVRLPKLFSRRHSEPVREVFREVKVRPLLSPGRHQVGWVIIIRDITLEKQQQVELEQFAYLDSLTGLFNRRQLEKMAEEIFLSGGSRRLADDEPSVAFLYIDLNQFKVINDNYGHTVGDVVLQHFAQCLKRSVRQEDRVVRLGGDEFVALLYDADRGVAEWVRSRLRTILNQETVLAGHRFRLSTSIGVAYYPEDGQTLQSLLEHADKDMYREKRLGRDRNYPS